MIDLNMTVEEALACQPRLASLLVHHHMICVGCDIARFHTLREAALMYHLDPDLLLSEFVQGDGKSGTALSADDAWPSSD